jgi:hypothetical protein
MDVCDFLYQKYSSGVENYNIYEETDNLNAKEENGKHILIYIFNN